MRSMKANFWMGVGVLAIFALFIFTPLAKAGGGSVGPTILPQVEGWWEVGFFGTSLTQNKERGVVAEDVWVYAKPLTCQDTWCQADIRVVRQDGYGWKEVGSGSLSLPPGGNSLWYNLYYYETGDSYYGNVFHFGNEMEGSFSGDKWECSMGAEYCTLASASHGRITFKK